MMKMKSVPALTRLIEVEGQLMHDKWGKERRGFRRRAGTAGTGSRALIEPETFAERV